jgi:Flp pilus assembly protein TadG
MVVLVLRGVHRTRARGSSAQSLVEFALIVPVLVLLFLGAVDLTRAFYYYIALDNASRATARVLVDYPAEYDDTTGCTAGHNEGLPYVNVSCAGGTLVISPAANANGSPPSRQPGRGLVTVTAKANFTPLTFIIQNFTGNPITIQASTTWLTWY